MDLTVAQLLLLVRGAISTEPRNLATNDSLRLLARVERVVLANPSIRDKVAYQSIVQPSADFFAPSKPQKEPEAEPDAVEAVPKKRIYKREDSEKEA